ncbi:DNA-directed RNA polymerase subunit beta [Megasphaera micronuciformis]|uniref:DNA-directed RNA polymerase subunit beta n=1 Tax=Megasphaera micronuciformis F0359 TaxID=706434 RepID=E2ZBB5_9FIRM|nr:DNA-directed RNA polymerase subunit beta [Megasphaera micronuciformis]EFQ04392.1 DNA-directed RNA polymerase, beta subunit [Megasphaera micronuciformis F0359]
MFKPVQVGKRTRYTYAKINEVLKMPHLLDLQTKSYKWFLEKGLKDIFKDISPIEDASGNLSLSFEDFSLGEPKYDIRECKERDTTYSAPLRVQISLLDRGTGERRSQEVFMGDFPLITDTGTFIINGAERVIVSQLVRSPGVYYGREIDPMGIRLYSSTIIPNRGAWIELETDTNGIVYARIDRNRKIPATVLIRALGWPTNNDIMELFYNDPRLQATFEKDTTESQEEALVEIYKKLRPGEPPTVESARSLFEGLFFDPRRYDMARVGRYKAARKLGWEHRLFGITLHEPIVNSETGELVLPAQTVIGAEEIAKIKESGVFNFDGLIEVFAEKQDGTVAKIICNNSNLPYDHRTITKEDIIANIGYLLNLMDGFGNVDDIDHLGNRRLRCVGELLQNQFRIGLTRMERVVRERMTVQDAESITPQALINIRPVVAAIKEFFGSSQLSQFMDQTNPLAELTHKRRLSALGPGGLSRERAGFEVRDVHHSHYGRMCPVETPEGPNIGLISSLACYSKVNEFGFIEAPYRRVDKTTHVVTDDVHYITADEEEQYIIAQANEPLAEDGTFVNERVACRHGEAVLEVARDRVDFMDVSPREVVSVGTSMIPFLENDDANRALMGANMQRQAVPLLRTQAPLVGTGMEYKAACDSGVCILAKHAGKVARVTGDEIIITTDEGGTDTYKLIKFVRSNQSTCINQRPLVYKGERVERDQVLADGMATDGGELALGYNILVAYMPWEGYNYEDAVLLSEELPKNDIYTSIHVEEYECDARDTKLGAEEITREIPNVSEDSTKDLDEGGIIRVGADVVPGDVLVGKVTPKGETELTPEERLLRAIFGDKEREVRDTSLRVPHGESGKIVAVRVFSRENNDELPPGVNQLVRVYIAQKRKIHEGDKMAGRHGNKGVVSRVMRQEDMPFLPDGTSVQIVLNPLGVPSRMNIGQILETHLGWAMHEIGVQILNPDNHLADKLKEIGYDIDKYGMIQPDEAGVHIATPVFDGAHAEDVFEALRVAGLPDDGKTVLYDGRTGEPMDRRVTVGYTYFLKLHHLVDDKIHARSTGPYSLVTQQPLGGKAQFGGQRFGEMEVWALEAYGAAYTLQEMLTVKSDDVVGRVKAYEKIVKGENIPEPGVPESFKVLLKELQAIGLNVQILNEDSEEVVIKELDDEDELEVDAGKNDEMRHIMEGEATGEAVDRPAEDIVTEDVEEPADNGNDDGLIGMGYDTLTDGISDDSEE